MFLIEKKKDSPTNSFFDSLYKNEKEKTGPKRTHQKNSSIDKTNFKDLKITPKPRFITI